MYDVYMNTECSGYDHLYNVASCRLFRRCVCDENIFCLDNECPPGIDEKLAFKETANQQYRHETQCKLDETLEQQYGQVNTCSEN